MDKFSSLFTEFLKYFGPVWNFNIITSNIITISIGKIILASITFIIGFQFTKYFTSRIKNAERFHKISDKDTQIWLEKFIFYFLVAFTIFLFFTILGISLTVFTKIWNAEIFSIQSNSIELGNLIIGLVVFSFGVKAVKFLSTLLENFILSNVKFDIGTKKSLINILRYLLIFITSLIALSIIGIPLKALTVIGGALAIGVGLGSQNLVNNFLSGLVLMAERPLTVGDVVEIENNIGTVEQVGVRSTIIRTFDNLRLVLPNSKLLENTVINWSLKDKLLRRAITLGVAYGSNVEKVKELSLQVAKEHPDVQKKPKPIVLLTDFGDNAIIFDLLVWIKLKKDRNPFIIDSDLRFAIYKLFNQSNIMIPFPQRDVHIDTNNPINVNVISRDKN